MLLDFYALAPQRSAEIVTRFLDRFLPDREQSAVDYEVPEHSDNPSIITNPDAVIKYSVECKSAAQRIYWRRLGDGEPRHAHVFFLTDGGLILGFSVEEPTESSCNFWLNELKEFVGSGFGYYVLETPPVESAAELKRLAEGRRASG
jgi:hypothetical protein